MLKNILNRRLALISGILVVIAVSSFFVYTQKIKKEKISNEGATVGENIIPEWAIYTHPTLGYTIEYPKNILPQIRPGDSSFDTYFYKNTPGEDPTIFISLRNSQTLSISERSKFFPSEVIQKTTISGVGAYTIHDSKYPHTLGVELNKDGVFYSIGVRGLPPAIIDHIINSFHINFVPVSMKLH